MADRRNSAQLEALCRAQYIPEFCLPPKLRLLSERDVPLFAHHDNTEQVNQVLANHKGSVRKPTFKTKRSRESHEFQTITEILPGLLEQNSEPGIIQSLLARASNTVKDQSKREDQDQKRHALLGIAAAKGNLDLVWLLAPSTCQRRRDGALLTAVEHRHTDVILKLLEYGADPNVCGQAFKNAALRGDLDFVSMFLRAPTPVRNDTLVDALTQAVDSGSIQLAAILTQAAELRNLADVPGLRKAVQKGLLDMLLVILRYSDELERQLLDSLVMAAYQRSFIDDGDKLQTLEALIYAGAGGDQTKTAFRLAVQSGQLHVIKTLAKHHIDIDYNDGAGTALVAAAKTGRLEIIEAVLSSRKPSQDNASGAIEALPVDLPHDQRLLIDTMLLNAGACGTAINGELVQAVRDNDQGLVAVLLRHHASSDYNGGEALVEAVRHQHVALLDTLLKHSKRDSRTLEAAFSALQSATIEPRLQMTTLLLKAGASGPIIDAALADVVCDASHPRDPRLIDALLQAKANVSYDNAKSLRYAIGKADVVLFQQLLGSQTTSLSDIVSSLLLDILGIRDRTARCDMMRHPIYAGASSETISLALTIELAAPDCEVRMIDELLRSGRACMDFDNGRPLRLAAVLPDGCVLEKMTKSSGTSARTITAALCEMLGCQALTDAEKSRRAAILLRGTSSGRGLIVGEALSTYVTFCARVFRSGRDWPPEVFSVLLTSHALDFENSAVIGQVIDNRATNLLKTILAHQQLNQLVLDNALLQAVVLKDKKDREEITEMLLAKGPTKDAASKALIVASEKGYDDVFGALLVHPDVSLELDEYKAVQSAVSSACLDVLLGLNVPHAALSAAFDEAARLENAAMRFRKIKAILKAGLRGTNVDDYLIQLVESQTAPIEEIGLLLENEASVHAHGSLAVVTAAVTKQRDVLSLLFDHVQLANTASRCFEACLDINFVEQHEIRVLKFLLERDVRQDLRDKALWRAARDLGPAPPGGLPMIQLLVDHQASPDYTQEPDPPALCRVCELGRFDAASSILSLSPNRSTRSRALYHVVKCRENCSDNFCGMVDAIVRSFPVRSAITVISEQPMASFAEPQQYFESAVRLLLRHRPGDWRALRKILDHGCIVNGKLEKDLLFWCMVQSDSKIKNECLQVLIEAGANVKYREPSSGDTILLAALTTGRAVLLDAILKNGADPSLANEREISPLLFASQAGYVLVAQKLLDANVRVNDGSVHQAAARGHFSIVKLLLERGANPNYRSRLAIHAGRTPLAELYQTADAAGSAGRVLEDIISEFRKHGADIRQTFERKPLILLAFENAKPIPMVTTIMSAYLSDYIDDDFNLFEEDGVMYSPAYYLTKVLAARRPQLDWKELLRTLRAYGSNKDVYYHLQGPQPADAVGMPDHILEKEARRIAREEKLREEEADDNRQIARMNKMEAHRQEIEQGKHQLSLAWSREKAQEQLEQDRERNDLSLTYQRNLNEEERRRDEGRLQIQQKEQAIKQQHLQILHQQEISAMQAKQTAETAGMRDRQAIATAGRQQIAQEERKMIEFQTRQEKTRHGWRMDELAMASAIQKGPARGYVEDVSSNGQLRLTSG
ncbi:hypothetical protein H2200_008631 [Cladophialophora chaetospira]|uniref:Ankyrin repeat protein n=1 Tax=Cladophialophora chaetospira TaxID=386627 RepID=A0AA39CFH8_9EURO|nr:hypothetical protein H2200_008631 [Cladophialophora chaetospira]